MRISYSALETYKSCPLKFKYQELDKIKTPKSIEAVFGSSIHSALKRMFQKSPLFPTLDETTGYFSDLWSEKASPIKEKPEYKAYFEEGKQILERFYKKNPPWNFNILDLESRFEVAVEDESAGETHILAGIIDRIDKNPETDAYEIIDYKTAKKMPSQDDADSNLQLSIYNLGLLKKWPHIKPENITVSLYFLKHNEKISSKRTKDGLEATKKEILNAINEIKESQKKENGFPPTPSALCDWCGYKKICPMWRHMYKTEAPQSPNEEEIKKITDEYFEIKETSLQKTKRLKEISSLINKFMDAEKLERVFGSGGFLTRITQERVSYDSKKMKEILKEIGRLEETEQRKTYSLLKATKNKKSAP
jgi:RecB family exonuclease